ncbi:hypothetical protein LJR231_003710 [Phyllobacterium sp. LjRoot231]|uniref:hypothetical protein n=1 Tax=Phyllobacterium sp. LjRoot231 TaxID=3342289 RepID=UPI003ECD0D8B
MNASISREIEVIDQTEANCLRIISVPGIGPLISTAVVAAIGRGEAFDRERELQRGSAWYPTIQHWRSIHPGWHFQNGVAGICEACSFRPLNSS